MKKPGFLPNCYVFIEPLIIPDSSTSISINNTSNIADILNIPTDGNKEEEKSQVNNGEIDEITAGIKLL